jgi:recombination protein RecR
VKKYPPHLIKLIDVLRRLPGVGNKSAERYAFDMINWSQAHLVEMAETLTSLQENIISCTHCGCLIGLENCHYCDITRRDTKTMCVVASPKDVFAIEDTHEYRGLYHVLGGVLSPLEGKGSETLNIAQLQKRINQHSVKEIVIALDSTLEGDATALYLKQELGNEVHISRLAFGIPMGSSLDYVDGGTLARALSGRRGF